MENNKINNSNTAVLTIIGLAILFLAVVGATFAYFSVTASIREQSLSVNTANPSGLIYSSNSDLIVTQALPGDYAEVEFTVENPSSGTIAQRYSLKLHIDQNEFTKYHEYVESDPDDTGDNYNATGQLVATIIAESSHGDTINLANNAIDLTDGDDASEAGTDIPIVTSQLITVGDVHTYTLNLEFVDTGLNQDENKNKSFGAHIVIGDIELVSNETVEPEDDDFTDEIAFVQAVRGVFPNLDSRNTAATFDNLVLDAPITLNTNASKIAAARESLINRFDFSSVTGSEQVRLEMYEYHDEGDEWSDRYELPNYVEVMVIQHNGNFKFVTGIRNPHELDLYTYSLNLYVNYDKDTNEWLWQHMDVDSSTNEIVETDIEMTSEHFNSIANDYLNFNPNKVILYCTTGLECTNENIAYLIKYAEIVFNTHFTFDE